MFERYNEQARRVVFFARYEATQRGSEKITTAHLLLGLTREKDSRADAIGSLRSKIPDPCELLGIAHRPVTQVPLFKKAGPPLDNDSKKTLAYAAQEADRDKEYWIDTDHILRALLCFPNEASPALDSIPLDLNSTRARSKSHRIEFPSQKVPILRFPLWFEPIKKALIKLVIFAIVCLIAALLIRWLNY